MKNRQRSVSFVLAFACLSVFAACTQKAHLAEYKKFTDAAKVPKISVEDAKKDVDAGLAVIVDSRGEAVFKAERIAGAINIPNGSPKEKYAALPKDKKVIIYCSCGGEGTSISLAYHMNQALIGNTYALVGGTQAWKDAGYPMEKGE